ncbi:ImuA family protein [Marinivivus vitaminiproducens]|uniref:ImuA family protein n=1 Tax=Marinivivus vitaminiproducens TaxID=3035935 RepID=UPI00279D1330|nr:damage-inducible mutagenesis protein [Geminicoccaceae bacterium SCSIO 64248]
MSRSAVDPVLLDLRRRVRALERPGSAGRQAALPFGIGAIDAHLPAGGLALGCLHEVVSGGRDRAQGALAARFVAGILARLEGPVLWCLSCRDLFAPALATVGLHPDRVLFAETGSDAAVLPAAEEGLRHAGLAGVVAESTRLGLTTGRRLQLAASRSGTTALVLRRSRYDRDEPVIRPSAAVTRWRVSPLPSQAAPLPGLARALWHLELTRCRNGVAASWIVEACDATGRLGLPPDLADRSAAPAGRAVA